jgi:polysaccharide pyruvyl transferase WcaK-like protein
MQRILLYTAAGQANLGDEYILQTELVYLRERYPTAQITVATYDMLGSRNSWVVSAQKQFDTPPDIDSVWDQHIQHISYFPNHLRRSPIINIGYLIQNIWATLRADLVIVGGGGLFYDSEAGQSFMSQKWGWGLRLFFVQLFRKKLLYWSIGMDLTLGHLRSVAWWFTYARAIVTVRESYSQALLGTIGVDASVIPDPVFLHIPESPTAPVDSNRVGIALRPGYLDNETITSLVRGLQSRRYEVVLLTHSLHPDSADTNDLSLSPLAADLGVAICETLEETVALYPTLQGIVSMRLHASILAVCYNIPFYAISYGVKTRAILEELGLSFIQDAESFHLGRFFADFESLMGVHSEAVLAIRDKSATIRVDILSRLNRAFSHY